MTETFNLLSANLNMGSVSLAVSGLKLKKLPSPSSRLGVTQNELETYLSEHPLETSIASFRVTASMML